MNANLVRPSSSSSRIGASSPLGTSIPSQRGISFRVWALVMLTAVVSIGLLRPSDAAADKYKIVMTSSFRYGNWGGGNYSNGKEGGNPRVSSGKYVDDLDRSFMLHDQAYADADDTYGPKLKAAIKKAKGNWMASAVIATRESWKAAYRKADQRLVSRLNDLPVLKSRGDGTDTWNGWKGTPSKKPSFDQRAYALGFAREGSRWGLFNEPPFRDWGG